MNVPVLNVWDETQQKYVGIPAVAGGGATRVVVNVTIGEDGETFTADKTFAEISAAIEAGENVRVVYAASEATMYFELALYAAGALAMFTCAVLGLMGESKLTVTGATISADNSVSVTNQVNFTSA